VVASILIAATTFVHGVFVAAAAAFFRAIMLKRAYGAVRFFRDSIELALLVLWLMTAHFLEIVMWAWTYLRLDLFDHWEKALYFSGASYTTLGSSDVILPAGWRLLGGATGANGFMLFGLSAAFLFEIAGQLHLARRKP
ncbi:MAG: ion channel, partial [Parvularculaceae bacterium]